MNKKIILIIVSIIAVLLVGVCALYIVKNNDKIKTNDKDKQTNESQQIKEEEEMDNSKSLVLYFSATGPAQTICKGKYLVKK